MGFFQSCFNVRCLPVLVDVTGSKKKLELISQTRLFPGFVYSTNFIDLLVLTELGLKKSHNVVLSPSKYRF